MNHLATSTLFLSCICLSVLDGQYAVARDRVEGRFDSNLLTADNFEIKVPQEAFSAEEGFRFSWTNKKVPFEGSYIKTAFAIRGDFDILLKFKVNNLGRPDRGWGAGILVRLEFDDATSSGISVQRQARTNGDQVLTLDQTRYGQAYHQVMSVPITSNEECGGIRLQRKNSTSLVVSSISDAGDERIVWEVPVSSAAVVPLGFHLHSGGSIAEMDVTFLEYAIEADELLSRPSYRLRSTVARKIAGAVGVVFLLAALCFRLVRIKVS